MSAMDAIAILENLGLNVIVSGTGKVKEQSISAGERIGRNRVIKIVLS